MACKINFGSKASKSEWAESIICFGPVTIPFSMRVTNFDSIFLCILIFKLNGVVNAVDFILTDTEVNHRNLWRGMFENHG